MCRGTKRSLGAHKLSVPLLSLIMLKTNSSNNCFTLNYELQHKSILGYYYCKGLAGFYGHSGEETKISFCDMRFPQAARMLEISLQEMTGAISGPEAARMFKISLVGHILLMFDPRSSEGSKRGSTLPKLRYLLFVPRNLRYFSESLMCCQPNRPKLQDVCGFP